MKAPNLLCCASLAFVNQRVHLAGGGMRRCSHLGTQKHLLSALNNDIGRNICDGSDNDDTSHLHGHAHRRKFVQTISQSLFWSMLLMNAEASHAACLSGDVRAECIGVYKLPIDAPESPYMDTPEKLKVYAPDLQWVPPQPMPSKYIDALNQLKEQRLQLDAAQDLIAKGDLEKAGLVLLDIIPKVTTAGIVIVKAFNAESNKERNMAMKRKNKSSEGNDGNPSSTPKATSLEMKAYRIEYSLNELLGYLGETDILIGQGLRGELGVSAAAQIEILSNFAECRKEFGNLISAVPDKVPK